MQAYVLIRTVFEASNEAHRPFNFYFFLADGRPAPLTKRQVERMEEKKQISVCFILFRPLFVAWLMYTCTVYIELQFTVYQGFFHFSRKEYSSCLVK